jgi:hypothetical protein
VLASDNVDSWLESRLGQIKEDVRMDEEILANVSSFNEQNTEISDGENEINSELEEENESDYDSDGH